MSDERPQIDSERPSDVSPTALTTPTEIHRHAAPQRGVNVLPSSSFRQGRFGRMFRNLPVFELGPKGRKDLDRLAETMTIDRVPEGGWDPSFENPNMPAGYTYLGQFIDHDITFDPVSSLQRQNDPDALHNFRTPRFDLDSVYGNGPSDQPYLYEGGSLSKAPKELHGVALRLGKVVSKEADLAGPDLPRTDDGRALTGDPRNDENLVVSQLHTVFLRFHNAVVDHVMQTTTLRDDNLFKEAQRITRWHYQWVVVNDFLTRIVDPTIVQDILRTDTYPVGCGNGETATIRNPNLRFYRPQEDPYMPVEFSVAAYRFGHSMVRPDYTINRVVPPRPIFSDDPDPLANLNGFRPLPKDWGFQWQFFFDLDDAQPAQRAFKIDTRLALPLATLPGTVGERSLAALNLRRGARLGVPAGQHVARAMGITPLTEDELGLASISDVFVGRAPLWYYVLKEAEQRSGGLCLGPVGGRIVAEVLLGLLALDRLSFLRVEPNWQPTLPSTTPGEFAMPDLIRFATGS